eukprot:NODE_81_length_22758_cov_0.877797.p6 type:complete len:298 gc:universal NODE_81_length_22758_cov_0.877797:21471-20578(-)
MGLLTTAIRNCLPISSAILLPLSFSINEESGLNLSLGYLLGHLVSLTRIPFISTTLQLYLNLNGFSVFRHFFFNSAPYKLQEPWSNLVIYYSNLIQFFKFAIFIIEPSLVIFLIMYLDTKVADYSWGKKLITLALCFSIYMYILLSIKKLDHSYFVVLYVHMSLFLMFYKQTEPVTGPIIVFLCCFHWLTLPGNANNTFKSSVSLLSIESFYKIRHWKELIGTAFQKNFWDLVLKSVLLSSIRLKFDIPNLIFHPFLLILYTETFVPNESQWSIGNEWKCYILLVLHACYLLHRNLK